MTYVEARQTALESLERGEAREAFAKFRWTMEYPGQLGDDPERWRDALTVFARIAALLAGDAFATLVRRAADAPDDVRALYDLGYGLIEQDLNGIRGHRSGPGQPAFTESGAPRRRAGLRLGTRLAIKPRDVPGASGPGLRAPRQKAG